MKVSPVKKPLPVGISDYREACTNYYYIDKTLLIKDFLDERPKVSLFTRPRRFRQDAEHGICFALFLRKTIPILPVIFRIKKSGSAENRIAAIRGNIPLSAFHLRM